MSKQTRQLFEQIKGGAASLKDIGGKLWESALPLFNHGRTEAAAALFSGSAHVMYMKGQDGVMQGQDQVLDQTKETPEIEREGREM